MFTFNFIPDDQKDQNEHSETDNTNTVFDESKEILPTNLDQFLKDDLKNILTKSLETRYLPIKYVCSDSLINILKNRGSQEDSILKAEQNHSDLLPAVYEGGLKIWECTYDLLNYFLDNKVDFKEKLVLDLGCGAGILGIVSLLHGGQCWFQDYNVDVIQNITIPNVQLNCEEKLNSCKFFSGDWSSFVELTEQNYAKQKFDYIVTSETIYNTSYYPKLHLVFERLLKKDGIIFLAAKSFYFGVGGGVHLFQDFIDDKRIFKYKHCWESTEGVKRNILKIEFL